MLGHAHFAGLAFVLAAMVPVSATSHSPASALGAGVAYIAIASALDWFMRR